MTVFLSPWTSLLPLRREILFYLKLKRFVPRIISWSLVVPIHRWPQTFLYELESPLEKTSGLFHLPPRSCVSRYFSYISTSFTLHVLLVVRLIYWPELLSEPVDHTERDTTRQSRLWTSSTILLSLLLFFDWFFFFTIWEKSNFLLLNKFFFPLLEIITYSFILLLLECEERIIFYLKFSFI